ncbi:MAG: four helix bundle protein [Candidatus Omnitrophica bacterium]|nr:four helix bundle protein [Candidatus Omnitrophota bacterium]
MFTGWPENYRALAGRFITALIGKTRKSWGDQFIESADSVGANIAEGYGRYHYLDKIKFYYTSRASLSECCGHWLELMYERKKVTEKQLKTIKIIVDKLAIKLNNFINATYRAKDNKFQPIS